MVGSLKAGVEKVNREEASPITSTSRDMRLGFRRESARWQGKNADFGQLVHVEDKELSADPLWYSI
jgi:hypothetical protein